MNSVRTLSLLSDFGESDEYVGVMKGVILSHCPGAQIVDLCHQLPAQDIEAASRMLVAAFPYFPRLTIHLAVVDPGVGTDRAILLAKADDHLFIAPDNGLLTPILLSETLQCCYTLTNRPTTPISSTFHGRDLMAPAAGKLAAGMPPQQLGERIAVHDCVLLPFPQAEVGDSRIIGEIVHIDHFGNLTTSIASDVLAQWEFKVSIRMGDITIDGLSTTYAECEQGSPLALINSRGFLEIAMNGENAATRLGAGRGDRVEIRPLVAEKPSGYLEK